MLGNRERFSWVEQGGNPSDVALGFQKVTAHVFKVDPERVHVRTESLDVGFEVFIEIDGVPVTELEAITLEGVFRKFFTLSLTPVSQHESPGPEPV
jgi:hypothetical protein